MEILSFDVCGKLAHFRKFYANNTAFTYSIPPRTSVMGMVAAAMGYPRDGYYERLNSSHLRVGVRLLRPVKKAFHRLNFLSIKSMGDAIKGTGDFTGAGGRIQTPFEVISGPNITTDFVAYRIFLAAGQDDNGQFEAIKTAFLERKQHFNLTLGTANFTAWLENVKPYPDVKPKRSDDFVKIHSALPSEKDVKLKFQKDDPDDGYNYLEEELMPADFVADGDRELSKLVRLLFSTQGKAFSAKFDGEFFEVRDPKTDEIQHITFIE